MQVWNVLHAARWKCMTRKNRQKFSICAPSHNFVGLYLRNWSMYRQSERNLLNSNISSTCPHNMVNFGPVTAEIGSGVWGTPANFNVFRFLAALLHGSHVVSVSQTAALNRGRHLCSAGQPSGWALAHILVNSLLSPVAVIVLWSWYTDGWTVAFGTVQGHWVTFRPAQWPSLLYQSNSPPAHM